MQIDHFLFRLIGGVMVVLGTLSACGGGGGSTASDAQVTEVTVLPGKEICAFLPSSTATFGISYAQGKTFSTSPSAPVCGQVGESMKFLSDGSAVFTYPDGFTVQFTVQEIIQAFTAAGATDNGVNIKLIIYQDGITGSVSSPTLVILATEIASGRSSRGTYSAIS